MVSTSASPRMIVVGFQVMSESARVFHVVQCRRMGIGPSSRRDAWFGQDDRIGQSPANGLDASSHLRGEMSCPIWRRSLLPRHHLGA